MLLRLIIWQSFSKWTATPVGVDRTTLPSTVIKLSEPVSSLILLLGTVRFIRNCVPSANCSVVFKKALPADISLIQRSSTCLSSGLIVLTLAGTLIWNLSNCRRSFIGEIFQYYISLQKSCKIKEAHRSRFFVHQHEFLPSWRIRNR